MARRKGHVVVRIRSYRRRDGRVVRGFTRRVGDRTRRRIAKSGLNNRR